MKKISLELINSLLEQNNNSTFIITRNNAIFRTSVIAAYIGFDKNAIENTLNELRQTNSSLQNLQVQNVYNVYSAYDFRYFFTENTSSGIKEYKRIVVAGEGYFDSSDIYVIDEELVSVAKKELLLLNDNDLMYSIFKRSGEACKINGYQPIYFSLEKAYADARQLDGQVFPLGDISAPIFIDSFSNFAEFTYLDKFFSGYELNMACKQRFEEASLPTSEICKLLRFPLQIYQSIDESNLMMTYYGQPLLFTSDEELEKYDKHVMTHPASGFKVGKEWFHGLFDKQYIFFNGKRHCRIQDFYTASC